MATKKISIDLIEGFAEQQEVESVAMIFNDCKSLLEEIVENVSSKNVVLLPRNKINIDVVGPYKYGSNTLSTDISLIISIESPQLQINSQSLVKSRWECIKEKFSNAWYNNRKSSRKKRKKLRKESKNKELSLLKSKKENVYSIESFKTDVFNELVQKLPPTCLIYNRANSIKVVALREFGINLSITFAIKSGEAFKLFNYSQNNFSTYKIKKMAMSINDRINEKGNSFLKLFRILNSLYYNFYQSEPPIFLIEFIMLSFKNDEIFSGSTKSVFLKFVNFVSFKTPYKVLCLSELTQYIDDKETIRKLNNMACNFLFKVLKCANNSL